MGNPNMPYTVDWFVPNQVIYCRIFDNANIDEIVSANEEIITLLETQNNTHVHIITDVLDLKKTPITLSRLSEASRSVRHENAGWHIVVTNSRLFEFLSSTISQIWRNSHVKGAPSLKDAIAILSRNDPTIEWPIDALN